MIRRFQSNTALLVIDAQKGVDMLEHWGGPGAHRNNPDAEENIRKLLDRWRSRGKPVLFTQHDSREPKSPLKVALPTGAFKEGIEPATGEIVVVKDVNGGFIGTKLEINLRRLGVSRLVVTGFFTNMCVETTVRQAGNMGFETYLAEDACATTNRTGYDGVRHDAKTVHALSVASMHGEFCTALKSTEALALLDSDAPALDCVQGNRTAQEASA